MDTVVAHHLIGIPASPGHHCGIATLVRSATDLEAVTSECVLVAFEARPDYLPALRRAGALVTTGGVLSNLATAARELRLPTVILHPDAIRALRASQVLGVFGSAGIVEIASCP